MMGIDIMDWPPYSPDLNPIENLWAIMKDRMGAAIYKKREDFVAAIRTAWASIGQDIIDNLIRSMPTRIAQVIERNGLSCDY
jgi:transposase